MIPPAGGDVEVAVCITLRRSRSRLLLGMRNMGGFGPGEGYAE